MAHKNRSRMHRLWRFAQAAALQVASMKTAVFTLSTLLNASTAVLVQATVPQAQSKLNNFYLKRKSEPSGSLFCLFCLNKSKICFCLN